jgi:hypothetical protein
LRDGSKTLARQDGDRTMNLAATPCFIGYGAAANNGAFVLFRSHFDFFLVLFAARCDASTRSHIFFITV